MSHEYFEHLDRDIVEVRKAASEGNGNAIELLYLGYALGKPITGIRANYRLALEYASKLAKVKGAPGVKELNKRVEGILRGDPFPFPTTWILAMKESTRDTQIIKIGLDEHIKTFA